MTFQHQNQPQSATSPGRGQKGQMAIFVALIFQVLFVLFAMAINVALLVHDKINLQNSVDLAAYYAAQRQAEMLNAIAHTNYQIRQSWKLAAWRIRMVGQMGLESPRHPGMLLNPDLQEALFTNTEAPPVCINYRPVWVQAPDNETLCKEKLIRIPPLPQSKVVASFNPINIIIKGLNSQLLKSYKTACEKAGAFNWWYAASTLFTFRQDQANRRRLIYALAENLSKGNDFVSLDGESVLEGVRKTIRKNLTFANLESDPEIRMMNSMAGIDPGEWLPSILVIPTALYQDVNNEPGCHASAAHVSAPPQRGVAKSFAFGNLEGDKLWPWVQGIEPSPDNMMFYSVGVEKNPWYMAYVGIQAKTRPQQIFAPFGPQVTLTARAFAKPFGGRIGPWYGALWPSGGKQSEGRKTDPLLPERSRANGLLNNKDDPLRIPNYSRFPGDNLGLRSQLALGSLIASGAMRVNYSFIGQYVKSFSKGAHNDILSWDDTAQDANSIPQIRRFELAAIMPDLFDITYYSIEPNFYDNYFVKIRAHREQLGIPDELILRPDLGAHPPMIEKFSVQDQMNVALKTNQGGPWVRNQAFYYVREKAHLLTSWIPGPGSVNYPKTPPPELFGRCAVSDDEFTENKNPGSCIAGGGRTGYSVKLISRAALFSSLHILGGTDNSRGQILNLPDVDQGW